MRLQVFLSRSGACSRRKALDYIKCGKVVVSGRTIVEPSFPVDIHCDTVTLCGKKITLRRKVYILLNKPKDVVTTVCDKFAPHKVLDLLPGQFRHLYPVGRLDKDTTGLLLLTNDGYLANCLSHPSFNVQKVYRVFLNRSLLVSDRKRLEEGIMLEGRRTSPCRIKMVSSHICEITLHEGRKRQIRKMFALSGYRVQELCRIKQGSLALGNLLPGQWRFLKKEELSKLEKDAGRQ